MTLIEFKEMKHSLAQANSKASTRANISLFKISLHYYELTNRTIRANSNIYYKLKPKKIRATRNLFQCKVIIDKGLNEFILSTCICWKEI